ncbi:hypothetical protein B0T18DRAFT_220146 [Schizothecium vesticola]|uniref:Uncharacterized protein n=1 Tax=Schizothecium vesticola TaxID=314040 RepID=A0AA40JZT0_9PEZI|nr:hypothetical protein B0T18DRAFT_220146 [Schizothecium vesticola]
MCYRDLGSRDVAGPPIGGTPAVDDRLAPSCVESVWWWVNTKLQPPTCSLLFRTHMLESAEDGGASPIHAAAPHKAVAGPTLHIIAHSRGSAALRGARRPSVWLQGLGGHYPCAAHRGLRSTSDRLFRYFAPSSPIPRASEAAELITPPAIPNSARHPETTSWTHDLSTFRTLAPLRHTEDASQRRGDLCQIYTPTWSEARRHRLRASSFFLVRPSPHFESTDNAIRPLFLSDSIYGSRPSGT